MLEEFEAPRRKDCGTWADDAWGAGLVQGWCRHDSRGCIHTVFCAPAGHHTGLLGCWGRRQLVVPKLKDLNLPGLAEVGGGRREAAPGQKPWNTVPATRDGETSKDRWWEPAWGSS